MPDIAIVNSNVSVEPKDYTLTGNQELLLKSVRASIDGSGAGSAFLPTLQLLAPDGTVMFEAVTSATVAAGGSADVSWFPRVSSGTGSSTTVNSSEAAYVWGIGTLMTSLTSGVVTDMRWRHFQTTNSTIFGTDTVINAVPPYHNTDSDSLLYFNKNGAYQVSMSAKLQSGAYAMAALLDNPGSQWQLDNEDGIGTTQDFASNASQTVAFGDYDLHRSSMFYVDTGDGPGIVRVRFLQTSGAAKSVLTFNMGAFYLGGTTAQLATIY